MGCKERKKQTNNNNVNIAKFGLNELAYIVTTNNTRDIWKKYEEW